MEHFPRLQRWSSLRNFPPDTVSDGAVSQYLHRPSSSNFENGTDPAIIIIAVQSTNPRGGVWESTSIV